MGDVWGRKPVYSAGLIMHIVLMLVIIFSKSVTLDYILCFLLGYSVTMRLYVGYTYNIEMQPLNYQVAASTCQFLFESVAYMLICFYFLYVSKDWRYL
jgi:MFS family permease